MSDDPSSPRGPRNATDPAIDGSRPDAPWVDRRIRSFPFWRRLCFGGRRMVDHRAEEDGRPYLVDRISAGDFAMAALLLILTMLDGVLTHELLDHGFEEANPVMRYLLERGTIWFFVGKYVLTALFLPVALVMNRYRLFGTRFRVGHVVPIVATLYLMLIVYQIGLWRGRHAPSSRGAAEAVGLVEIGRTGG